MLGLSVVRQGFGARAVKKSVVQLTVSGCVTSIFIDLRAALQSIP